MDLNNVQSTKPAAVSDLLAAFFALITNNVSMVDQKVFEIIRALEESLWRSETRFDPEYMERVLSPDFLEFGRSGRDFTSSIWMKTKLGRQIRFHQGTQL